MFSWLVKLISLFFGETAQIFDSLLHNMYDLFLLHNMYVQNKSNLTRFTGMLLEILIGP